MRTGQRRDKIKTSRTYKDIAKSEASQSGKYFTFDSVNEALQ